jgi:hypothetical protein
MIAGDGIAPAFPIIDHAKRKLPQRSSLSVDRVADAIRKAYEDQRSSEAESAYLKPIGWTMKRFNSGAARNILPEALRIQLYAAISKYELPISLLVAGFDGRRGRLFSIGRSTHGIVQRHDIPGFHAIGSGSTGARFMMYYRKAGLMKPVREMAYYAIEAKYFGELASGVGPRTDMVVIQPGGTVIRIPERTVENTFIKKLCQRLEPGPLGPKIGILNEVAELSAFPRLKARKIDQEWEIRPQDRPYSDGTN